jgi:tRNA pseudouridine38-40 synthase
MEATALRNIRLTVSYDGTAYHGWQRQPNALTVEEVLTGAIGRILDHEVKLYAGARTDAGVHAMGQVVNFACGKPIGCEALAKGVNSVLPRDIRVRDAGDVDASFHARYSAKRKTYVYCILNRRVNSPFLGRYVLHFPFALDIGDMRRAVRLVVGEHDFSAFKKKDEAYRSTVRRVLRAGVARRGDVVYVIIEATGFLRYMVRNIVGTVLDVGEGRRAWTEVGEILAAGQRERAGAPATAHGLFLREIVY